MILLLIVIGINELIREMIFIRVFRNAWNSILPFTGNAAEKAGKIYISLRAENKVIEAKDLFIAATALSHDYPIMTLNVKHFDRIPNLNLL